jgi:hypothetical protein
MKKPKTKRQVAVAKKPRSATHWARPDRRQRTVAHRPNRRKAGLASKRVDPLAQKSLNDFRNAPGYLHKDDTPEVLASVAELGNGKSSVATATDGFEETRTVTVVRERWAEFQKHEKHFSKELATALVDLNKLHAKPGSGKFEADLKELKIPKWTAYRVMALHYPDWKGEGQKKDGKKEPTKLSSPLVFDKWVTDTIGYFDQFKDLDVRRNTWDRFKHEVESGLGWKASNNGKR